jgi:hypothetical protein
VPAAEQSWSAIALFDHSVGAVGHEGAVERGLLNVGNPADTGRSPTQVGRQYSLS